MQRTAPRLLVLAIDIGSSSVRSALFDERARHLHETDAQEKYAVRYEPDGGAVLSPAVLQRAAARCLKQTLGAYRSSPALRKMRIAAVGGSGFWHSLLGLDEKGKPLTPIYTWADSRSDPDAKKLRAKISERAMQMRTGCMLRSTFWPAKLLWLRRTKPKLFARVAHWSSPADLIFEELFGVRGCSISMASATGLFDHRRRTWHKRLCQLCAVTPEKLPQVLQSAPCSGRTFPELAGATIYFPIGDGAASNLAVSEKSRRTVAISVGTSAAVRATLSPNEAFLLKLPFGLFRYIIDENHFVFGGATSNAGNLRVWSLRELNVDQTKSATDRTLSRSAAAHDELLSLPFWVDERAPSWPGPIGGVIAGLRQTTTAGEIYRVTTTAVFNRIAQVLQATENVIGRVQRIVLSAGITRSGPSVKLLADVLGRNLEISPETEASLRGAAVYALEKTGCSPPKLAKGRLVRHNPRFAAKHRARRERQAALELLLNRFSREK